MRLITKARVKVLVTIAALGLAIPGSLLGSALASSFDAPSSVTIRSTADGFKGDVDSGQHKCVGGRTVKVKKRVDGPDKTIGTDTTNSQGKYSVSANNPHGRYYAKVLRSEETTYGGTHICEAARSDTIHVT